MHINAGWLLIGISPHALTHSNEVQHKAYQKFILVCYYCATVQGNSLLFQQEVLVLIYM